jgi:hypothetical protein
MRESSSIPPWGAPLASTTRLKVRRLTNAGRAHSHPQVAPKGAGHIEVRRL